MTKKTMYLVAAAALFFAWLFRFEIVAAGGGEIVPIAYRLDRWTGQILLVSSRGTLKLEEMPVPPANPFDKFDKE